MNRAFGTFGVGDRRSGHHRARFAHTATVFLLRDDETPKEQPRQEAEEQDQQTPQEAPKDQQHKEQEPQK